MRSRTDSQRRKSNSSPARRLRSIVKETAMNTRAKLRFPLALVLLGSLAAAQGAVKTPPASKSPPAAGHEPSITLRFHVTGLTEDNLAKVRDNLIALDYTTYACDKC